MLDKKNLVIVRAGDDSLHESWLKSPRNWDMIVSCFGKQPQKWRRDDIRHIIYQGGKFDGLYDAFQQVPGLLDKYDYIMMADDDFIMTADDISRVFDMMREYDLQIGQPSFSHKSYATYFPEYHNPSFKLRFTNFAEAGMICLSPHVWRQILPLYQDNPRAFWIDNFWARLTDDPARQIALLDDVQVTHSRPCDSGDLYKKKEHEIWADEGPVPYSIPGHVWDLDKWILKKIICHDAILANGRRVSGRENVLPFLEEGWREVAKNVNAEQMTQNRSVSESFELAIENQRTGISNLSKTKLTIHNPKDKRKNLVIVNASEDYSAHERWMIGARNWDITLSYPSKNAQKWQRDDVMRVLCEGGKFDSIYEVFQKHPDLIDKYEFVFMPSPYDIMRAQDINRIFDMMREYNLQISQPSLSHESGTCYFPFYHHPRFKLRFINFISNGSVCISMNVFQKILPLFEKNPHAWGVNSFWARLADDPAHQVALLDDVQIALPPPDEDEENNEGDQENKTPSTPEEGAMQYGVSNWKQDMDKWHFPKIVCHAGILADGPPIVGREKILPMLISQWHEMAENIDDSQIYLDACAQEAMDQAIENQKSGIGDLSKAKLFIYGHRDKIRAENRTESLRKLENSNKKNLVIARAGEDSLHESWLNGTRNWDMLVSHFKGDPEKWQREDVMNLFYKGGKGDGLYDAFQQMPALLDKYDYIMMADDDFDMTADDINRTFDIMREHDLQIGQPSFSHKSYATYFPEYHNPNFKIRFSNFAEASTVCLSSHVWRQILPLYEDNPHAWWIDNFWTRLTDDPARQAAIIDDVQITHTRPCKTGALYQNYGAVDGPHKYSVLGHRKELDKWFLTKIVSHAGVLANGKTVRGRWAMLPYLISGWLKTAKNIDRSQIVANRSVSRSMRRSIKNQITGFSKLTKTRMVIHGRHK